MDLKKKRATARVLGMKRREDYTAIEIKKTVHRKLKVVALFDDKKLCEMTNQIMEEWAERRARKLGITFGELEMRDV